MNKYKSIKIQGLGGLEKKLAKLQKGANKIIRQGLRAGAKVILSKTKPLVPVQSGALRKSLKVRSGKKSRKYIRFRVSFGGNKDYVGDFYYGSMVNYGTVKMSGRHFMESGFESSHAAATKVIMDTIKEKLLKV